MKLLVTGDWHLTDKTPRNRTDDYPATQHRKISWMIGMAIQNQCRYILQPGDMFDSFKVRDRVKTDWIERWRNVLSNNGVKILTVPGQHDMRYHTSDLRDTPMGVLEAAGAIRTLVGKPLEYPADPHSWEELVQLFESKVFIYGSGWNAPIPDLRDTSSGCNILVTHRMVISGDPLWPGQTDYEQGELLLRRTKFDLIVTGDNHRSFIIKANNRMLINCGSLMRSTIDQIYHIPCIYIYDTTERKAEKYEVHPLAPIQEVLLVEEAAEQKERNEKLEAFVEGIRKDIQIEGLDFKHNIHSYLNSHRIKPSVKRLIEAIMANG
jgi:DNA repair exonuclease SbcCD nuclease subunit